MELKVQVSVEGSVVQEVSGEISGTLSQRESLLRELFREVEGIAQEQSLRHDQPLVDRPECCGRPMKKSRLRERQLLTPSGMVTWGRQIYACGVCGCQTAPLDDRLGIPNGQFSPRLANLGMDFVQGDSYERAADMLKLHHGVCVSVRSLLNLAGDFSAVSASLNTPPMKRPS